MDKADVLYIANKEEYMKKCESYFYSQYLDMKDEEKTKSNY